MTNTQTKLTIPENADKNIEAKKYYTFNETGNIMISSTANSGEIEENVKKIYSEVAVFFAAMTRAISTTENPATPGKNYSLYNYHALERIIDGSGLFVHVTESDVIYETSSFGLDFSKELIQGLLGLATGAGSLAFASSMISSLGKEGLRISGSSSSSESKVGNIVFVCEYLLGMPIVSAVVAYADCKKHAEEIQAGPCFKEQHTSTKWELHKDTYLFVTPDFISKSSKELSLVESDPNYKNFINLLQALLKKTPTITGTYYKSDNGEYVELKNSEPLVVGVGYRIMGEFLPNPSTNEERKQYTLKFDADKKDIKTLNWSDTIIEFSVDELRDSISNIGIYKNNTRVLGTNAGYKVVKTSSTSNNTGKK
ncbi:Bacterial Ig-like domain-containing protein [Candidatus Xenohaliotis californiensis]|uniref:Bacterial Ig-like domain-containing protein n=1 Tax=Candidatus Xenohaliotis californiensis TaxID=84677 RepID=A0ABP0EUM8_9RICK|nr:Bacterial Ig-like domain-containing protein [Candidatus Xenohaliotis californiensis]